MTPQDLEEARLVLGYTKKTMCETLQTPISTYTDWVKGNSRIPGPVKVAVKLLLKNLPHKIIIHGVSVAVPPKAVAYKYDTPLDPERWIFDNEEANEIKRLFPEQIVLVEKEINAQ